jgi:hypothetical protein
MSDDLERLARMEEQMKSVMDALGRIEANQKTDSERIARLEQMASAGKGALKALLWVGGIVGGLGVIGGLIVSLINLIRHY